MKNNDINKKYITILKKIKKINKEAKSIDDIKEILYEIDDLISSSNNIVFGASFTLAFYSMMKLKYNNSSIGDLILDETLTKKEKLSPSLIIYYYIKQKEKFNSDDYNIIEYTKQKYVVMGVSHFDNNENNMIINYDYYLNKYPDNEEFNYQVMESIMHEINHIYQASITPESENIYERIIYNDVKIWREFIDVNSMINYIRIHNYFMVEFQAYINSKSYMIEYAKSNPQYFNKDIVSFHEEENNKFFKKYAYPDITPRELFNEIIQLLLDESYDYYTDEEYDEMMTTFNGYLEKENEFITIINGLPDTWEKVATGCVINPNMKEYKKVKSL